MKTTAQPIFIKGVLIVDDRGKNKNCQLCGGKFSITNSEHQCKRCKRAVCEKCAAYKAIVQRQDKQSKKPHRQCNFCKEEQDNIRKFIDQYKILINTDTFSVEWLKTYGTDPERAQKDYENAQVEAANQTNQDQKDMMNTQLKIVLPEIDSLQNYSLKDFTLGATRSMEVNRIKEYIERILGTFLLMYPEVGYSAELVLITYFLLCFASEASTYLLLTIIYGHIIPSYLYAASLQNEKCDYTNESGQIIGMCRDVFKLSDKDQNVIQIFTNERINRYILQLSINMLLFETTFFVFNQLFAAVNEGYSELMKFMAVVIYQSNAEIQKHKQYYEGIEMYILRNVKSSQITVGYQQTSKINLESYKNKEFISRANSINTRTLSFVSEKQSNQQIQFELLVLVDQNKKLQDSIIQKDQTIMGLQVEITEKQAIEKALKLENFQLKDRTQKLQLSIDSLQSDLLNNKSRENPGPSNDQDMRIEMVLKQNKQLHQRLEAKEAELLMAQEGEQYKQGESQLRQVKEECAILTTKLAESKIDTKQIQQQLDQQIAANGISKKEIISQKEQIDKLQQRYIELEALQLQTLKQLEAAQFEISLHSSFKAQEEYQLLYQEEIAKLNREIEKQQVQASEQNNRYLQLERQMMETQKQQHQDEILQQESVFLLNQQITQLEQKLQLQDQVQIELVDQQKRKTSELQEEIALLQLSNENLSKKLEERQQQQQSVNELQQQNKQLEQALLRSKTELDQLQQVKYQADNKEYASDTGSMDFQNTLNITLNQKNEEIALLSELNTELTIKIDEQTEQLNEQIRIIEQQRQQLKKFENLKEGKMEVIELQEQNNELQFQLEESRLTQSQLLEQLEQLPPQNAQIYQFSDSKIQNKGNKDFEDAKNVIEIKTFQNQILKGLLKENQLQLTQLNQTILGFRNILTRAPRTSRA